MKYLQEYMEDRQTALFEETGAFFCFSKKQFDEGKKEGVEYVSMGGGMVCDKKHAKKLHDGLEIIWNESIAQDLAENTKEGVIRRELSNHEAYYTGSIESTLEAISCYGITAEEIIKVYNEEVVNQDM